MSNSSIWPIDRTHSGATPLGQIGPGSNGNERVLRIPQRSKTGVSPSDCLLSHLGHSLGGVNLTLLQKCSQCFQQPQLTGLL